MMTRREVLGLPVGSPLVVENPDGSYRPTHLRSIDAASGYVWISNGGGISLALLAEIRLPTASDLLTLEWPR